MASGEYGGDRRLEEVEKGQAQITLAVSTAPGRKPEKEKKGSRDYFFFLKGIAQKGMDVLLANQKYDRHW